MDMDEAMEKTAESAPDSAKAFGIKGSESVEKVEDPEADEKDETPSEDEIEQSETSQASETSKTLETESTDSPDSNEQSGSESVVVGGVKEGQYPNPDKENGALTDLYENINIYVPPEVKEETHQLFKELEYRFRVEHEKELDKHWDFYTALFRTVLRNDEDLREELGLDREES